MRRPRFDPHSIAGKLYGLILNMFVPMVLLAAVILILLVSYNVRNAAVTGNITTASQFNQDFRSDVDLKMYYYVSGASQELPEEEIAAAHLLAATLLANTTNPDS